MARTIDYGHYIDQTSFEHQLTKELEQLTTWICQVTDMDLSEALDAVRDAVEGMRA